MNFGRIIIYIASFLMMISSFNDVLAQEETQSQGEDNPAKNVIYGTIGTILYYNSLSGSYERRLVSFKNGIVNSIWIKAGYGKWVSYNDEESNYYLLGPTILFFNSNSHLEISIYTPQYGDFEFIDTSRPVPGIAFGYRYQKNTSGIVFRIGGGTPELAYFSFGFSF